MSFLLFTDIPVQPPSSSNDVWKYIIMGLVGVIFTYTTSKIEQWHDKKKEKKAERDRAGNLDYTLKYNNDIQKSIKEVLIQIQGYTECSRASLYSYHNGTTSHYGYSMNFISMVEEKTDGIVVPLIDTFQKIPAAIFRPILEKIDESEEGYVAIRKGSIDDIDQIMDKYQNTVCYDFKVGNSVWEGVVELAWVNKSVTLSESEVDHVQELVNNIADLQRKLIKP